MSTFEEANTQRPQGPHTWNKIFLLIKGFHKLFEQNMFLKPYGILWDLTNKSDQWINVLIESKTIWELFVVRDIYILHLPKPQPSDE